MKLVEEVKSHSSKWIKTKGNDYNNFYWRLLAINLFHFVSYISKIQSP